MREKTPASEVTTTSDVNNRFHSVPGPGHVLKPKCGFKPSKRQLFPFSGENKLAHDNRRVSNYKIMKKSQLGKFRFSGTLSSYVTKKIFTTIL